MTMKFYILSIILSYTVSCEASFPIGQGTPAVIEQYPYLALVEVGDQFACAGVILDDLYVLSTNSCVGELSLADLYVRVGTDKLGYRGQVFKVINVTQYSSILGTKVNEYLNSGRKSISKFVNDLEEGRSGGGGGGGGRSSSSADFVMIKVAAYFDYTSKVTWANPNSDGISEQKSATLPVWSNTAKKGSRLLSAAVIVQSSTDCSAAYNNTNFSVTSGMYCLSSQDNDNTACLASLGTPLFYNQQVYGIVVHSPGCDSSLPVVVNQIADHTSFLISAMCEITSLF